MDEQSDTQVPVTTNAGILNKKLSQHVVNLAITLVIAILLLINFALPDIAAQWQQLRLFSVDGNTADMLAKLLPVRVGIAFVFLWYSIDNFEHPEVFNNLGNLILKKLKLEKNNIELHPVAYVQSALEALVAISMVTGIFLDGGALLGSLLLVAILFAYEEGLGSLLIRDIGLLGATITIFAIAVAGKF